MTQCRCNELSRLDGDEAAAYAKEHLVLVERGRSSEMAEDYACSESRTNWVMDFPLRHWSRDHRGTPRLRRLPLGPDKAIDAAD